MNILVTHPDPILSAKALDDLRVIKMILESTQLLNNALANHEQHHLRPVTSEGKLYTLNLLEHRSSVWCSHSIESFKWVLSHAVALCEEYQMRFARNHFATSEILKIKNALPEIEMRFADLGVQRGYTSFDNNSGFKDQPVIAAYRLTLVYKWTVVDKRKPTWTHANRPDWFGTTNEMLQSLLKHKHFKAQMKDKYA